MKRMVRWTALVGLLMLGLAPAAGAGETIFALDWVTFGRHTPYFVALEKGFYKEAGLDIKIVRGYGSADGINKIATGQATFAFGDAGSLIIARGKGAKVKMVAMTYGKSPFVFFSLKDANITKPKDLEGRSIAAPTVDGPRTMFPVFVKLTGIDANKVKWLTVDGAQKDPMLLSRKADLITSFWVHRPIITKQAREHNLDIAMMKWADYGYELYSNGILVGDEFIRSNPQAVKGFVQGSIQGHKYAFEHLDEAVAIMLKHNPTLDREVVRAEVEIVRDMTLSEDAKRHGIGWINDKTMQMTVDAVADVFKVERPPLAAIYTNEFLK